MKYLVIATLVLVGCSQKPTLAGCVKEVADHYRLDEFGLNNQDRNTAEIAIQFICNKLNNNAKDVIVYIDSL